MTSSTSFTLGFVRLSDAAPFVVAQERGFFQKYGLKIELEPQNSWATLRDKLEAGSLDAAQMLAPMPIVSALGISGTRSDIMTPLITSQNGNGVTLSNALCDEIINVANIGCMPFPMPALLLKNAIECRKKSKQQKLRFAAVYPFSCHYLQLLDYLVSDGIEPIDVDFIFIPPTNMTDSLERSEIDGFCVGGPYNAKSVRNNSGTTIVTSHDIWKDKAEKVLGITNQAYETRPLAYQKLCAAIIDACEWLKDVPNRFEAACMLSQKKYLDTALEELAPSLIGSCLTSLNAEPRHIAHYNRFSSNCTRDNLGEHSVNRPTAEQGEWLLSKIRNAWPQLVAEGKAQVKISDCFREDIFTLALKHRKI